MAESILTSPSEFEAYPFGLHFYTIIQNIPLHWRQKFSLRGDRSFMEQLNAFSILCCRTPDEFTCQGLSARC
jgi:hypothetical protein